MSRKPNIFDYLGDYEFASGIAISSLCVAVVFLVFRVAELENNIGEFRNWCELHDYQIKELQKHAP